MKLLFKSIVFVFLMPCAAFSQTPTDVLSKIETALGGIDALRSIQTLQYKSSIQMNVMGQSFTIGVNNIKENGKLCRRETDGMFGMKGTISLITDTGMYIAAPNMTNFGEGRSASGTQIEQAPPKAFLLSKYLLETQGYFAPLIDCYSKGNTLEIAGNQKINGKECIKTILTLISKQKIIYYINAETFLIEQSIIEGEAAMIYLGLGAMMKNFMGRTDKLKLIIDYKNYKKFGNVLFPTKELISIAANDVTIETEDFIINEPINATNYILKN